MYSQDIDRILLKIEKEAKNELAMFVQFGGSCFNLEDLERLRRDWQKNIHRYEVWHSGFILLCASSFFWFPISVALALAGLQAAASKTLLLCPSCFLIGFTGAFALYYKFGSFAYQYWIGEKLEHAVKVKWMIQNRYNTENH